MIDRVVLKIREIIHYIIHINIYYGKNIILRGVPKLLYANKIKWGKSIRLNDEVFLHAANGITIGENTTLSYGVTILTESYNVEEWNKYLKREHKGKEVIIGRNVWICANVTILPGVKIADNIIVGAGSIVTKDLLISNALYAGNPAVFKKELLSAL